MCKIVAFAVAVAVAATGSSLCTKSPEIAANSEAVATTVRILPLDILQSQIRDLRSR